jgi:hypothetical protein
LNKRNISQPERMIQFELSYIYITLVTPRTPNPDLWMLGTWGGRYRRCRRPKGVIDTDLRLNPNRIDYISHSPE